MKVGDFDFASDSDENDHNDLTYRDKGEWELRRAFHSLLHVQKHPALASPFGTAIPNPCLFHFPACNKKILCVSMFALIFARTREDRWRR